MVLKNNYINKMIKNAILNIKIIFFKYYKYLGFQNTLLIYTMLANNVFQNYFGFPKPANWLAPAPSSHDFNDGTSS